METNPTVEPDAPLPPDESSPQTTPTDNPPPEPAGTPVSEIAAEAAAAEGLPEPLVEVTEQTGQPEAPESAQTEEPRQEEGETIPVSDAAPEEASQAPAPESEGEAQQVAQAEASQAELNLDEKAEAEAAQPEPEATQPEAAAEPAQAQPEGEAEGARPAEEAPQETPAAAEGAPVGEGEQDPLAVLATHAQTTRLSPADEERAVTLLKEALLEGRAGVVRAIAALPKLPWVLGVNAVTTVWPEMKPAFRSQMLAGLVRANTDAARRMRLSLARGLFKQDVPIALKIIVGASREMRDRETGTMNPKHAQIFANVLIGRAKPWIAQLPLAEVKPNDADILVHCALLSAFSLPHAPITQLGVIKWAAEAGRLSKLHQVVIEAAQKSLARWSGKWQNALRKEVADLPESFTSVLKAVQTKEAAQPAAPEGEEVPQAPEEEAASATPEEPDAEAKAAEVVPEDQSHPAEEPDAEPAEAPKAEAPAEQAPQPKQRPVYESKTVPRKQQQQQQQQQQGQGQQQPAQQQQQGGKGGPTLKEAGVPELLRQLESQFQHLRSELHTTQSKLRQRDEDLRRAQKRATERASAPIIEGEPTPEELARLNRQLEMRNQELQARIEELLADSEARAVSVGAVSGEPVNDPNAQLRTLLGLKIQEDYADFLALEKESPDIVVQQHYRTVLRHVFEVLLQEGVQFDLPKTEGM